MIATEYEKETNGAAELDSGLRKHTALTEDLSSDPSTYREQLTAACNSSSRDLMPFLAFGRGGARLITVRT